MANTSTKNFPHAYGAGRCVAAFSLSHPGGPTVPESEDATRGGSLSPPAFEMEPLDVTDLDYPDASITLTEDASIPGPDNFTYRLFYSPDVQPFNATSFGVFATGSGLTSLPYRSALAPYWPSSVPSPISDILPGSAPSQNEIRPFSVVEETNLGSTRAQYVVQPVTPADPASTMDEGCCYYEVALDWTSPALTVSTSTATLDGPNNWATTAVASVRESLCRTLWVTATYGDSCGSEANPLVPNALDPFFSNNTANQVGLAPAFTTNPTPATGWEPMYAPAITFAGDPGDLNLGPVIDPSVAPSLTADLDVALTGPPSPHATIMLKVKEVSQTITNTDSLGNVSADSVGTTVMKLAPVIRIIVPNARDGTNIIVPTALPRTGVRASSGDPGLQPPCVNVQVWQKNSSATDGTTTPVYDIYDNWSLLGAGGL